MKNMKLVPILSITLLVGLVLSGCIDSVFDLPITYESHPTKISYTITYGYLATCTGSGRYDIKYDCDIPDKLLGFQDYDILYKQDFEVVSIDNNSFVRWNISDNDEKTYELGLKADVIVESFLVPDISGSGALSIDQINSSYPEVTDKYLQSQYNDDLLLIDPTDLNIKNEARNIVGLSDSNNSFLLAMDIFFWFSENTDYAIHNGGGSNVQPASLTLQKKTGDCDDLSFLYISLCRAVGIPARFIRGYLLSEDVGGFITATPHAWTEVFVGGSIGNNGWIPVECACVCDDSKTNVNQNFGVENAFHLRLFIDDGTNESLQTSLSGISYVTYGADRQIDLESFNNVDNYIELESEKLVVTSKGSRYYQ